VDELEKKSNDLRNYIASFKSAAIAFSGGVDSTFLLAVAHQALKDKVLAVTAKSCSFPKRELDESIAFCKEHGIRHIVFESEELDIEGFSKNPPNRCYLCKSELFTKIKKLAQENEIEAIFEGSNVDDDGDYRPGLMAVKENGIKSPLRFAGLSKKEIRTLSKNMGLKTWDKQSFACLSSRFPYGAEINPQKLNMVDKAEQALLDMGLKQVRVRHHGDIARIETDEAGFEILKDIGVRKNLNAILKQIGFDYAAIDLLGYRTGSMNETLK
jgi:uncharacterized protein